MLDCASSESSKIIPHGTMAESLLPWPMLKVRVENSQMAEADTCSVINHHTLLNHMASYRWTVSFKLHTAVASYAHHTHVSYEARMASFNTRIIWDMTSFNNLQTVHVNMCSAQNAILTTFTLCVWRCAQSTVHKNSFRKMYHSDSFKEVKYTSH